MTTTRKYEIDHLNVAETLAKANKVAARAVAKGLLGGYSVTTEQVTEPSQYGGQVTRTYLVIEGEPAAYKGWTFVAKVEYANGLPVLTGSPWYEGPQVDRATLKPNHCDECGKKIARSKTIVVEDESGTRLQVGTACVKDFLGHEVTPAWYSASDVFGEFDGYSAGGGGGQVSAPLAYVAVLAAAAIRSFGFTPKSATWGCPTASKVSDLLHWNKAEDFHAAWKAVGPVTEADEALAAAAVEFGKAMPGTSDYALNAQAVFADAEAYVGKAKLALVVSVVGVLAKQQAEAKAAPATSPAPTGKVEVTGVVTSVKAQESQWGTTWKMIVQADGGYKVWSTVPSAISGVEIGDKVCFTATLEPSDRDECFAFAKRPTKAQVLVA